MNILKGMSKIEAFRRVRPFKKKLEKPRPKPKHRNVPKTYHV